MLSPIGQETLQDTPALVYPLTEPAGSISAVSANGAVLAIADPLHAPLVFGDNGPGFGDGTGIKFAPSSSSAGQYLTGSLPFMDLTAFTIELWVNAGTALPAWGTGTGTENILGFDTGSGNMMGLIYLFNGRPSYQDTATVPVVNAAASIADGGWHHIACTRTAVNGNVTLYVDGVSQGATGGSFTFSGPTPNILTVGESASPFAYTPSRFQGNIGHVGFYQTALSSTRIAAHFAAGRGYVGDTTGTRISRYLTAAGLTSADWTLAAGVATLNTYAQQGKNVLQACQDMATTEGHGAAVFVDPAGSVRFVDRTFRRTVAPVVTIDAANDMQPSPFSPSIDESVLTNSVQADRASESGTQTSQTYTLPGLAAGDAINTNVTTYTLYDADALYLAQYQVAVAATPAYRLPQLSIELASSLTSSLAVSLAAILPGSRIRVMNLPSDVAPATQMDFFVEGWTEQIDIDTYVWTFDLSPADNPPFMVLDDPAYSRLQADSMTAGVLTNSGTSMVITTAAGKPTLTTVSARYPMNVQLDEEVLTITAAPGGSTSPQTVTVTRGQQGTPAAAHPAGSVLNLYPAVGVSL
jgi:hypothetical protein